MTVVCQCGGESGVLDSRRVGGSMKRRRECEKCHARWTTWEVQRDPGQKGPKASNGKSEVAIRGGSLIKLFFEEKRSQNISYDQIEKFSGVNHNTMHYWGKKKNPPNPVHENLVAALSALGFDVVAIRRKET